MTEPSDTRLIEFLRKSRKIFIFTGAGISTPSGIPDYRGPRGVWKQKKPVHYQAFINSEKARIEYWTHKSEEWDVFKSAQPNEIHTAAVALEKSGRLNRLVTQNIDGLHAQAGTSPDKLVELHGSNRMVECLSCFRRSDTEPHLEHFRKTGLVPECECGGYLKPATISFGQSLRDRDVRRAFDTALSTDLVIALGTTLAVHPAASVPLLAARHGTPYVIVNRGPTCHDDEPAVTLRIDGDVQDVFPQAVAEAL